MVAIGLLLYTAAGEVRPATEPLPLYDSVLSSSPPADLSDDLDDPEAAEMPQQHCLPLTSQLELLPSAPRI